MNVKEYFEAREQHYAKLKAVPFSYNESNCYVYWSRILQEYCIKYDHDIDRSLCGMKYVSYDDAKEFCRVFNEIEKNVKITLSE